MAVSPGGQEVRHKSFAVRVRRNGVAGGDGRRADRRGTFLLIGRWPFFGRNWKSRVPDSFCDDQEKLQCLHPGSVIPSSARNPPSGEGLLLSSFPVVHKCREH